MPISALHYFTILVFQEADQTGPTRDVRQYKMEQTLHAAVHI